MKSKASERVADIEGGDVWTPGTSVITWPSHGGQNQMWRYEAGHIVNPAGGLVLEAEPDSIAWFIIKQKPSKF